MRGEKVVMKIENLTLSYGKNVVFNNFFCEFKGGKITCILGRSGVGKTTLLKYLAGLLDVKPSSKINASMVFQEDRLLKNLTVKENLLFAGCSLFDIDSYIEKVGLLGKENLRPSSLSGGEKQRVNFLRAILNKAPLILLDEPFSSLDLATKLPLISDFRKTIKQAEKTAILVTHDVEEALLIADEIMILEGGKITLALSSNGGFIKEYGELSKDRDLIIKTIIKSNA